ncbi:hypothetical protein Hanom_Chr05g00424311 [Helianthus anomalus]
MVCSNASQSGITCVLANKPDCTKRTILRPNRSEQFNFVWLVDSPTSFCLFF